MWTGAIIINEQNAAAAAANPQPLTLSALDPTANTPRERQNSLGSSFDKLVEHAVQVTEHYAGGETLERPLPSLETSVNPIDATASAELSPVLNKFKLLALQEGKKKVEEKRNDEITAETIMNTFTEALRVAVEEKKLLRETPWYILLPDNPVKRFWELYLVVLLGYTVSILPIREAFEIDTDFDGLLDNIVDFSFMIDFALTLITAIEGPNGEIITDIRQIAISYAKSWMVIDFLSSFPYSMVAPESDVSTYTAIGKSMKIPRLTFRFLRLAKLMRTRRFQKLFYDLEYSPLVHQGAVRCLKLIVTMLVIGHFSACLWHKVGALSGDGSWIQRAWNTGIDDSSLGYQYLASLYWAWQTLTTVGYGDIHAQSSLEMIASIVVMTTGATVFSYVTATVSSLLQAADVQSAVYRENMHKVSTFISDRRLPPKLQARVVREMGAFYRQERQVRMDWAPLMSDMSKSLRTEVIQTIYQSTLETSSFLNLLSNYDAKIDILAAGETIRARPGQYVATYGYPTDYWYLIITGSLAAVSSSNANIVYQQYVQGTSLGEIGMFLTNIWPYSLRSTGDTVLLRVATQSMFRVVGNYEGATKILLDKAERDLSSLLKAKKTRPSPNLSIVSTQTMAPEILARLSASKPADADKNNLNAKLDLIEESLTKAMKTLGKLLSKPITQ